MVLSPTAILFIYYVGLAAGFIVGALFAYEANAWRKTGEEG
jgi:hypothetical protein